MKYFLILILLTSLSIQGAFGQSRNLAQNYFQQGEFEKAESLYKKLYQKNSRSVRLLTDYTESLQAQEKYEEAEALIQKHLKRVKNYPPLRIELGYNQQLAGKKTKADKNYQKVISEIEKQPNYAYASGSAFQDHNLLDYATFALEIALDYKSNPSYTIKLAKIYGEQGKLKEMFSTFLDLVSEKARYFYAVNRNFSKYISKDPETEANTTLRKILLKRLQKNPKVFYNEMLSWLYTKEQRYNLAFVQEKAIYRRSDDKDVNELMDLARAASNQGQYEAAKPVLNFIIDNSESERIQLRAQGLKMDNRVANSAPKDYPEVAKAFDKIIDNYGTGRETVDLQLAYAQFLAFSQKKPDKAKDLLQKLLKKHLSKREEGRVKMKLGDILVFQQQFNQALIYFSQIQNLLKNSGLAQKAGFKVAQTSYYKGDFEWAQTQLKILKQATSQKIANDAMELNLLIQDNIKEDSLHEALKLFAKSDLYQFQSKNDRALSLLDSVLTRHKGNSIEDNALLRKGNILSDQGNYDRAAAAYQTIVDHYADGILADNAYYALGKLYQDKLDKPEKAKDYFREIVFNFSDSIFYVDARKRFRKLRGDSAVE